MRHGEGMQAGNVAAIDNAEIKFRAAGQCSVHEALDEQDGGGIIGAKDRAEDAYWIDGGEFETAAFFGDEVPSSALGQSLRFRIRGQVVSVWICPMGLIEGRALWLVT